MNNTENHMLDGHYEESTQRPEPEFDSDAYYCDKYPEQVEHEFPLETRIKGLLIEISETDRVPVQLTIEVLHEMLKDIEVRKGLISAVTSLKDTVESSTESIRSKLYQGGQA